MGNAFVSIADDINSIHYNPAGLGELQRPKAMASHSIIFSGLSDGSSLGLTNVALSIPIRSGKGGNFGGLWNQFRLSGVYDEKTLQLSYGYSFSKEHILNKISFGASLKYLTHSFSRLPEAYNAVENNFKRHNNIDEVLIGANSQSAFDVDAGFIYRLTKRYTIGFAAKNILQPNMSFAGGSDKIPMKLRLGVSHKSLWMILASEIKMEKGPTGAMDREVIVAAERIFPSLDKGEFGLRTSLGMGTREFKQATAGLSYKINKIEMNYGFSIPIGTIKEIAGNHKIALIYHFGGPTVEEQYALDLLDQYNKLRKFEEYKTSKDIANLNDERLKDVREKIELGRYEESNKILLEKAKDLLPDSSVLNLSKRLSLVASFYPSLPKNLLKEKWEILLDLGIWNYLNGADTKAIKQISYAQSLNQGDMALSRFLEKLEETTHIKADRVPSDFSRGLVEYKFYESDILYNQKKYEDALSKLQEILEFEPENNLALKKAGSCSYLLKNYKNALTYWDMALKRETESAEREKLIKMINDAKSKTTSSWAPEIPAKTLPEKQETAPQKDVREIERLYQLGTEYYTKGEYSKSADIFRQILTIDPENAQAQKALERILKSR